MDMPAFAPFTPAFAPFTPLPEDVTRRRNAEIAAAKARGEVRDELVKRHGYIELRSDYLDMSSYYLDPSTKQILEFNNGSDGPPEFRTPDSVVSEHLAELNGM